MYMENASLQWNPELYQGSSSLQHELGIRTIEMLKPGRQERILDLGCGNGLLTIEIARRIPGGHVTGIEASSEMVGLAKQNAARLGITNISLININALDIDFMEEYDALFSNSAIHWIHDLDRMYRLIFRSLKPGGRITVQTSLKEPNTLYETIYAMLAVEKYRAYFRNMSWPWRFLTRQENIDLLARTGFTDITVERYQHNYTFKNKDELSGYLESAPMVPFMSHLPEDEQPGFRELFVTTYLGKNNSSLGSASVRAFIAARKE